MLKILLAAILVTGVIFLFVLVKDYMNKSKQGELGNESFLTSGLVGMVANFFDTLGIGSFAIETSLFKNLKLVGDKKIPGTLNVGATIPTVCEALIFLTVVQVEPITLISMILAAVAGALIGAGIISKLNEKAVQGSMGLALVCIALIMIAGQLNLFPVGGNAIGLSGGKLIIGIIGNFIFGALNTLGIGLFAPCMALVFALGMDPKVAFPIMMGSGAILLPFASFKFIKEGAHAPKTSLAINIMGPIGVLVAAYLVKSLPLTTLKWLVIGVVLYTAFIMYKSFKSSKNKTSELEKSA
ncbi:sulfite exporter TauE/SafE family protein [Clostridium aciditolerans]|uniref:Probable membrane transporter protein n=1 Tax=Clostridium aciditolerans TaxID=339861 RepID=A0A934HTT8_9CLOT|nr:sulfite exporter TauE/SafE family protein [Clostridium aciditolerans]MBI6871789.1 sulfite exporter TauE/SafE family protein [Clostridium aciditolerans]